MADLEERLRSTDYPGRGIFVGRSADGEKAVIAYFIMGRSQNSRNRIFVEDGEGIRTQAYDEYTQYPVTLGSDECFVLGDCREKH